MFYGVASRVTELFVTSTTNSVLGWASDGHAESHTPVREEQCPAEITGRFSMRLTTVKNKSFARL